MPVTRPMSPAPSRSHRTFTSYRLVRPSERYGDVVTELQAEPLSEVLVVLDLDQNWPSEQATHWIRSFLGEYQRRLPVYTGQKDYCQQNRPAGVPMVVVFKSSVEASARADLVRAGASVYDRSSPSNRDCQTPEQLLAHFAALARNEEASASSPGPLKSVEPLPGADPQAYNGYPPGIEPGMLGEVLRNNLNAQRTAYEKRFTRTGNIVFRFHEQPTQEQQTLMAKCHFQYDPTTKEAWRKNDRSGRVAADKLHSLLVGQANQPRV
jgi:hypothetical protein